MNSTIYVKSLLISPELEMITGAIIEINHMPGIGIHVVGMPDEKEKETLLRVITGLQALGYHIPGKKIIINLAADIPVWHKAYQDTRWELLDYPIALGLMRLAGTPYHTGKFYVGEMALDGTIRQLRPDDLRVIMEHYAIEAPVYGSRTLEAK